MFEWMKKSFYIFVYDNNAVQEALQQICDLVKAKYQNDSGDKIAEFREFYKSLEKTIQSPAYNGRSYYLILRDDQIGELMDRTDIHRDMLGAERIKIIHDLFNSHQFHILLDNSANVVGFYGR